MLKTGDLVEPEEFFNGYYHSVLKSRPEWVGVVTRVVNATIEPALVEVAWSHGEVLKHYSDDLRALTPQKHETTKENQSR